MSEIEIPADGKEAWQAQMDFVKRVEATGRIVKETTFTQLADLAVYLLAGWMRSEFMREHIETQNIDTESPYRSCRACGLRPVWDERHFWDLEQYKDAAHAELMREGE